MVTRSLCVVFLSLSLTQCGFVPRIKHKKEQAQTPIGEVRYDVSALSQGLFPNGNPIGSLIRRVSARSISYCSAFAISAHRIMTNHHCVSDEEAGLAKANDISVIFRNAEDDNQTTVTIESIVDWDRDHGDEDKKPLLYDAEAFTDWAILETDVDLNRYSPLEVQTEYLGADFFANPKTMTFARVNPPPPLAIEPYVTTLDPVEAKPDVAKLVTEDYLKAETAKLVKSCKLKHAGDNPAVVACEKETYTKKNAFNQLEKNESFEFTGKIRLGNSGSPLVYAGKAVGIAHIAFTPPETLLQADQERGIAQFFHHLDDRLAP